MRGQAAVVEGGRLAGLQLTGCHNVDQHLWEPASMGSSTFSPAFLSTVGLFWCAASRSGGVSYNHAGSLNCCVLKSDA
jgi:hypothetical protein